MAPHRINILVACECSQAECLEFRRRGFNAFSCDIRPAALRPDWHVLGDVTPLLAGRSHFVTQDGRKHALSRFHMIVAHPPCTFLTKVSAVRLFAREESADTVRVCADGRFYIVNRIRWEKLLEARKFFLQCYNAQSPYVCVENPTPLHIAKLPPPSCYSSPHLYGDRYRKTTYYWLRNLPPLMFSCCEPKPMSLVYDLPKSQRSVTRKPLAEAIAEQYGAFILNELSYAKNETKKILERP